MRIAKRTWRAYCVMNVMGLCIACSHQATLQPAKSANLVLGIEDGARAEQDGITLTAISRSWVGRDDVKKEITPLRVMIENRSEHSVQIKYSNFDLVAQNGQRFAALPPLQIEGEVVATVITPVDPYWTGIEYEVAPYYGPLYGDRALVWQGPFMYDYAYYDEYYPMWTTLELPTAEMLRYALPEGTLKPKGRVDGFLYFQKVTDDAKRVVLHATLVDSAGEQPSTTLTVPFDVES